MRPGFDRMTIHITSRTPSRGKETHRRTSTTAAANTASMNTDVRVRVRFVTKDPSLRLPPHLADAPLAVPVQLNRKGLSEVVHHLRGNPPTEAGDNKEGGYDFAIEDQLLRCSLDKFLRATGISTEATVTVEYFRSLRAPTEGPKSSKADTWIGSLAGGCGAGGAFSGVVGGGYDGVLRLYGAADCGALASVQAHEGPIKAVAVAARGGDTGGGVVLTGGKDRVLRAWRLSMGAGKGKSRLAPGAMLVGHENSVEAVAMRGKGQQVLSGDWGGMVFLWKVPGEEEGEGKEEEEKAPARKKRKGSKGGEEVATGSVVQEAGPLVRLKAHAQCVSGVAWDATAEERAFTASWDHAVKVWDLERQDCIQTLNGSKVVTSLAANSSDGGRLLTAGHPDGRVRLWDLRGANVEAGPERRALAPCGSWVTDVAWLPGREGVGLASVSHDGKLRVWDLRATKPLFTVAAHGDKALALCAGGEGALFTGGADGVVRRFDLP